MRRRKVRRKKEKKVSEYFLKDRVKFVKIIEGYGFKYFVIELCSENMI